MTIGARRVAVGMWVAIACAVTAMPASAFKSFPKGAIHAVLTEETVKPHRFSRKAVKRMVQSNFELDWNQIDVNLKPGAEWTTPNAKYQAGDHFDRVQGVTHSEAFKAGVVRLWHWRNAAVKDLSQGKTSTGVAHMGRALHVLQDFYSHSNYVDLTPAEQEAVDGLLLGRRKAPPPATIRLTGFDAETGKDVPVDPYPHDAFAKDSPTENAEAQLKLNGKTKYRVAYEAALRAGRQLLLEVRKESGEAAWKKIKTY